MIFEHQLWADPKYRHVQSWPKLRWSDTPDKGTESGAGDAKKPEQLRIYCALSHPAFGDSGKSFQNQPLPWFLLPNFPLFLPVFKPWLVFWPFHQFCEQVIPYPSNKYLFCSHYLGSVSVFATKEMTGTLDNPLWALVSSSVRRDENNVRMQGCFITCVY